MTEICDYCSGKEGAEPDPDCPDAYEHEILLKVEKWHRGDYEMSLHEFLGFTYEEYDVWVTTGDLPSDRK